MPDIEADLLAEFDRLKIKLPLKLSPYDMGDIIDSDGRHVCICDFNCERHHEEAVAIALCVVRAINTCAGYNTERIPTFEALTLVSAPDRQPSTMLGAVGGVAMGPPASVKSKTGPWVQGPDAEKA